jgi:DNA-binding CsgD family transcriptional regulator
MGASRGTAKKAKATQAVRVAQRQAKVAELYLSGMTMMAVGKELGISDATVCTDLAALRTQWRTKANASIDKLIQNELSHTDWVEMEATKAWHRSVGIHKKTITKEGTSAGAQGGSYDETVEHAEELAGDPRFLDIINKCVDQRCKILGLIAPTKSILSNPDGSPLLTGIKVVEVGKPAEGTKQ